MSLSLLNTKTASDEIVLRLKLLTSGKLFLTIGGQYLWRTLQVKWIVVGTGRQKGTYRRLWTASIPDVMWFCTRSRFGGAVL